MEYFETIMIYDGRITEERYKATVDHFIKIITDERRANTRRRPNG